MNDTPLLIPSASREMLIIDDEEDFRKLIGTMARILGYHPNSAESWEEASAMLVEYERNNVLLAFVTIDMRFQMGKNKNVDTPRGAEILFFLKKHYLHIPCIMISGAGLTPDEVLDLRDTYNLDYYLPKDKLGPDTLQKAIARAADRVSPLGSKLRRRKFLEDTIERYRDMVTIYTHNLSKVEAQKALTGFQIVISLENEIDHYRQSLSRSLAKVKELEQELAALDS